MFQKMTGVTVDHYKGIVEKMRPYWDKSEKEGLSRPDRKRKIGGGPKYHLRTLPDPS